MERDLIKAEMLVARSKVLSRFFWPRLVAIISNWTSCINQLKITFATDMPGCALILILENVSEDVSDQFRVQKDDNNIVQ